MNLKNTIVAFFSFFLTSQLVFAQVIEDLSDRWNKEYMGDLFSHSDQLNQWVNLNQYPESFLVIRLSAGTSMFINEKLWYYTERDTVISKRLKEYHSLFRSDSMDLRLLGRDLRRSQTSIAKSVEPGFFKDLTTQLPGEEPYRAFYYRAKVSDFFILSILICLFLMAVHRQSYPLIFWSILNPAAIIRSEDFTDSAGVQKASFDVLFFVFITNMLTALSAIMALIFFDESLIRPWFGGFSLGFFPIWIGLSLVLQFITFGKFLLIRVVGQALDLGRIDFPHFFYLLRLIVWANILFLLSYFFFLENKFTFLDWLIPSFFNGFFWYYLVGVGLMFVYMMNHMAFKKYHLFIYLCIAEVVPFLILVKWVTDTIQVQF